MQIPRTFSLVLLVVAVALIAAACGGSGDVAATVDGYDITVDEVESLISEEGEQSEDIFSQSLATLIQWRITEEAASDLGVSASESDVDDQLAKLLTEVGAPSAAEFAATQGITEDLLMRYVRQLLIQERVTEAFETEGRPISDAEAQTEIDVNSGEWTEICAAHILLETQEEAEDVLLRLDAGESFADLAAELSTDPGSGANGGDLGCSSPEGYVPTFAAATLEAPIDEPFGPVESDFGHHILLVSSRSTASLDEVRASLQTGAALAEVDAWFLEIIAAAEVDVPSEYGEWVTEPSPAIVRSS
ncbi:MAG: peptidylprolyl isomerase [Acidimicrobiia bacterium]